MLSDDQLADPPCFVAYAPLNEGTPSTSPSPAEPRSCGDVRLPTEAARIPQTAADCLLDGFAAGEAVALTVTRDFLRGGPAYPLTAPGEAVRTRYEVQRRRWVQVEDGRSGMGLLGCPVLRYTGSDLVGDDCDA